MLRNLLNCLAYNDLMVQTQIDATEKIVRRDLNGRLGFLGRERRLGDKAAAKRKQDSRTEKKHAGIAEGHRSA